MPYISIIFVNLNGIKGKSYRKKPGSLKHRKKPGFFTLSSVPCLSGTGRGAGRGIMGFKYFLYHMTHPVQEGDDLWKAPLPMNREHIQKPGEVSVTHGDIFFAIRSFLEKEDFETIRSAVSKQAPINKDAVEIEKISICLEKHGEFYHPARVEAIVNGIPSSFVVNAAVSDAGRSGIRQEYEILRRLGERFSCAYVPRVCQMGEVCLEGTTDIPMFIGEWFEGYNEFHMSRDPSDNGERIAVWDPEGPFFLTPEQTGELYQKVALILTHYYDMETFEQIWPWHHAAGDFVVRKEPHGIRLKLITVRGYCSLVDESAGKDPVTLLNALLVFLMSLSLRTRLDRLEGVGEMAWSPDIALLGTVAGFWEALEMKPASALLPAPVADCFRYYLSCCTERDLHELGEAILDRHNPSSPEMPVIQRMLKEHAVALYSLLAQYS